MLEKADQVRVLSTFSSSVDLFQRFPVSGSVFFEGQDLMQLNAFQMRQIRGYRISMIFQDPMTSLNPVLRIGDQIQESLIEHQRLLKINQKKSP